MKWNIVLLIPFLFFCAKDKTTKPLIAGFDSAIWKKDSTRCLNLRSSHHFLDVLYCNKEKIIDITEEELLGLLGKPNELGRDSFHHSSSFGYFVEGGEQCWGTLQERRSPDIKTIVFVIKNNKVRQIEISSGGYPKCK